MSTMDMKYDLHSALGYQLTLAARHAERRFERALQGLGLTRITWCVALAVGGHGLDHPSDIAGYVGVDRTAVSRALRSLARDGLVVRKQGQEDGRTRLVRLTESGKERLRAANTLAIAARDRLETLLDSPERAQLRAILLKLQKVDELPLGRI